MYNILVLEKEEDRIIIETRLSSYFGLTFAINGSDVISKLKTDSFDCLIMNVSFDVDDKVQVCEYVLNNIEDGVMPVIIVTEKGHEIIDERILKYDISEIIQKPYGRYTLIKRIDNIISLFKQTRELILSNQELEEAYDKAKEAVELKTRFILNMSHDLRTPMNAIKGMTEMTRKYLDDTAKAEGYLNNLIGASDHLLNVINGILDMTYIESDDKFSSTDECYISDIIRDISVIVKQQCDKAKLNYELSFNNIVNENILVNSTRIKQLFINILGNSVKFTNAGGTVGIHIVELPAEKKDRVKYQFKFYDTGKGMSPKFMKTMFLPFEREENNHGPYVEGTGLGLAITKSIVDSMGGSIQVKSKLGVGSSFIITLEFEKRENKYIGDRAVSASSVYVCHKDRKAVRNILSGLNTIGVSCLFENDLEELIAYPQKYDILLIDIFEDSSYTETLKALLKKAPHIKVLHINDDIVHDSFNNSLCKNVLDIPFFPSEIYAGLKEVLRADGDNENEKYYFDGLRVLVVDDNSINRMIAMEFLRAVNIECVEATGGMEALDILKKAEKGYYDLVLMDVQMPDLDGCETSRCIRQMEEGYHSEVPIIAMTADVFADDKAKVIKAGMNAHLSKPFKREELYQCIEMFI